MDFEQICDAALRLSREEQLRLAQLLWEGIDRAPDRRPIPSGLLVELERRRLALEADPSRALKWNDAKRLIRETARD